ncbi:MAG: biotin--[acetyl-CoA-carboxylase] ligase [Myxococcota bacterium]
MTSDESIVRILRERGGWVSGEAIAEALGVSRAAVGKHMGALRTRGWRVAARRRVGYRLDGAPDLLEGAVVEPLLETRWLGRQWHWHDEVGSTNDEARALAEAGAPHGAVVVAEAQTRGRGRLGRAWHSPPRAGLHLSALLRPTIAPGEAPPITLAAGLAVAEAVEGSGLPDVRLKWPNDVRAGGRKLAGILTELAAEADRIRFLVVGIGVNVNTESFPVELDESATSLRLALGRPVDRAIFTADLCRRLERWVDLFLADGAAPILAAFRARAELGRPVRVDTGTRVVDGVSEDVDDAGALLVRTPDGAIVRVTSGDVIGSNRP